MEPEVLEEKINEFFNENYEGRYRASVDIDQDNSEAYIFVAYEEGSEKPGVGAFVDEIFDKLDVDNPRMEADWYPEENRYDIALGENSDQPLPGKTPRTSV